MLTLTPTAASSRQPEPQLRPSQVAVHEPEVTSRPEASSLELSHDISRIEHEERAAIDRRRQEQLARLRRIADLD